MSVGDLVVNLVARTDRFSRSMNQAQKGVGGFVSKTITQLGRVHLAIGGLQSAFSLLSEPLALADTQLKAERKLEQVFKSTGNAAGFAADEIKKFAAQRQAVTNFGDEATIASAAVLGTFTNIKGDVFKGALASAQDMSALMETDLQSSILMIGKALNSPAAGLSALSRAGVQFSDSQKDTIKRLEEVGRVADAQQIILRELQTQFGGQAEALADGIQQAKNSWGDGLEEIGFMVRDLTLEILKEFDVSAMVETAGDVRDFFNSEWKDDVVGGIKDAAAAGRGLMEVLKGIEATLGPVASKFRDIKGSIPDLGILETGLKAAIPGAAGFDVLKNIGKGGGTGKAVPEGLFSLEAAMAEARAMAVKQLEEQSKKAAPAAASTPAEDFGWLNDQGPSIPKEVLKERDRMTSEAAKLAESVMTPVESFQDEIDRLTKLFEGGYISSQTFDRAAQMAVDSLPQGTKEEPYRNKVGDLSAGSAQTYEVLRANVGANKDGKVPQQQLSELKKIAKGIEKMNKKSKKNDIEIRGFD